MYDIFIIRFSLIFFLKFISNLYLCNMKGCEFMGNHKTNFPWYVNEYFNNNSFSILTQEGYIVDFETFFEWLIHEDLSKSPISDISLLDLDKLTVIDIQRYKKYLETKKTNLNRKKLGLSPSGVARKLSSISSLFNYLANVAEYENGEPYINRNVLSQVRKNSFKRSDYQLAEQMKDSLLISSDEINQFLKFISNDYEFKINSKRQLSCYKKNKERDTAIISLLLFSGLRISELVSLKLEHIDLKNNTISITQKDDKQRIVSITSEVKQDLDNYLKIRQIRYSASEDIRDVFLTYYNKKANIMAIRSIQNMINKYADAFEKSGLTAQKLRHSFATRLFSDTKNTGTLQSQLGQHRINPAWVYTHVYDNKKGLL